MTEDCPCGTSRLYANCCGSFHSGSMHAPTAEQLMWSRYSAFVIRNAEYLRHTWHPDHCPRQVSFRDGQVWTGLEIKSVEAGGPLDAEGVVAFVAHYEIAGQAAVTRETSTFSRLDGKWVYVEAIA